MNLTFDPLTAANTYDAWRYKPPNANYGRIYCAYLKAHQYYSNSNAYGGLYREHYT